MSDSASSFHPSYEIEIASPKLRFSAAHFIAFDTQTIEPVHGHDYTVDAFISTQMGPHGYGIDFLEAEDVLHRLVQSWDHKVLLPETGHLIDVRQTDQGVEVTFGAKRWMFPREDVVLLPVENTTSELLCRHLLTQFLASLSPRTRGMIRSLRIRLRESGGFAASCTYTP
ncbi:MAG: 6-pyruvoyl tetrahydrobiopterin synthase [Planctomycetota bacterium]|nr:MAG: 6-pyruvoyl tetrahydrobiopterin synthase [Planctomycetota bacterium]